MKPEHVYNLVKMTIVLFVALFIAFTLWSVNNVITYFWHDGMRVFVVAASVVAFTALLFLHGKHAVAKKDKSYLVVTGIVGGAFLIITLAFVFLDYTINQFNTFDKLDSRLQTSVSVAVWITSVILLVCAFGLAVWHKAVYKKEMPLSIVVAELITSFFCIWANAWGTSDAVYKLTQDQFSAIAMAVVIDFMIFLMGAWYLIANDKDTAAITMWTVLGGIMVTTSLQITDGVLAGANLKTTEQIVNIAQFAFPVIFFLSFGLVVTTFFVDYFKGGFSFVKPQTGGFSEHTERASVEPAKIARGDINRAPSSPRPNVRPEPNRSFSPQHRLTAPPPKGKGGTPDKITDGMRWGLYRLNWDDTDIDDMDVEQALSYLSERTYKDGNDTSSDNTTNRKPYQEQARDTLEREIRRNPNGTQPKN